MQQKMGVLLVLSGPSGVGKGALRKAVQAAFSGLRESVSATTRAQRPGEKEGQDYFFLSKADFEAMIARDELVEWAEFAGNYYGTPSQFVKNTLNRGESILLEIDVQGALNIKRLFPEAHLIFIDPPSLAVLEQRLRNRNTNSEADIQSRLEIAQQELSQREHFDYHVLNDQLQDSQRELVALIGQLLNSTGK